jgi:catechol 2,3-dioxygenase-like lactoylglutathione lyase family enzyme
MNTLMLPCSDIERTKEFFVRLGFECRADCSDVLRLTHSSIEISFWRVTPKAEAARLARASTTWVQVENLRALFQSFKARKLTFVPSLQRQTWGAFEMLITDPDGNRIRFAE